MPDELTPGQMLARAAKSFFTLIVNVAVASFAIGLGCVVIGEVVEVFVESRFPEERPSAQQNDAASLVGDAVVGAFGVSSYRIQVMGADGLRIYIGKSAFESVAFPDRDGAVKFVSEPWCTSTDRPWLLPSVALLDIRSGETLAKRMCTLEKMRGR